MTGTSHFYSTLKTHINQFWLYYFQGLLIFALFDVKPKVYFVAYEKVLGRPHPLFPQSKMVKAYVYPASISSEAAQGPSLGTSLHDDNETIQPDEEEDAEEVTEKSPRENRGNVTPQLSKRTKPNIEPQNSKSKMTRQTTVSESWTSDFSGGRSSSEWEKENFSSINFDEDTENEIVSQKKIDSMQHLPENPSRQRAVSVKHVKPESVVQDRPLSFHPQTADEIRMKATSLRSLRKKLQDGTIDVSSFDSYQQLKLFQDIIRQGTNVMNE